MKFVGVSIYKYLRIPIFVVGQLNKNKMHIETILQTIQTIPLLQTSCSVEIIMHVAV